MWGDKSKATRTSALNGQKQEVPFKGECCLLIWRMGFKLHSSEHSFYYDY